MLGYVFFVYICIALVLSVCALKKHGSYIAHVRNHFFRVSLHPLANLSNKFCSLNVMLV
jgi:hypothetical protein